MSASSLRCRRLSRWFVLAALPAVWLTANARPALSATPVAGEPEIVDLFAAMKSGDVEAKIIPKNDRESRIVLKNNTKRPLSVRLPDAFAGVPALAQMPFGFNQPGANRNNNANQNAPQQVGGTNTRQNGNNQRNGFFNLPPEKVGDFKLVTVCLEHGKKDPKPTVPYELRPIESVVAKPELRALCAMLGQEEIDQQAAQAAAWHLSNDMTWEQLAAKRIEHLNAPSEPYFTTAQLQKAKDLAKQASETAAKRSSAKAGSPPASSTAGAVVATEKSAN